MFMKRNVWVLGIALPVIPAPRPIRKQHRGGPFWGARPSMEVLTGMRSASEQEPELFLPYSSASSAER
jgi:hypothetical protein